MPIEDTSIPGLLPMINARHPFTRVLWVTLYITVSVVLAWHMYCLGQRYCRSDISRQMSAFTNDTMKFPTVYLWLFYPIRVDFSMNYTIVHEYEQQRIYELSDWSKFEAIGQTVVQLPFCAVEITGVHGYLGVVDVYGETTAKGVRNPLIKTTKPLFIGKRNTLSIEMKQVSVLPPPYSACVNEYPSEFNLTATRRNSPYSQGDCHLYCRASWFMATNCSCSLREWTGLDTPASSTLPSCRIYGANDAETIETMRKSSRSAHRDDGNEKSLTDICRFESKYWFHLLPVVDEFHSVEASRQCNMCADQCSYTEYVSNLDTLPPSEVAACPPFEFEGRYIHVHKSTVIIDLTKRITSSTQELDYPAIEFYSEMLGIFGAYLGFSMFTFAEVLLVAFFHGSRKVMRGAYLHNEKNSVSTWVSFVTSFFVETYTVNAVTEDVPGTFKGKMFIHHEI